MSDPALLSTSPNGVATITLNRPESYNALNANLVKRIRQHIATVANDDSIRVLVITGGHGKAFCSGAEMKAQENNNKQQQQTSSSSSSVGTSMREMYNPLIHDLYVLKKPIIVQVNGVCAGGGVGLALVGDIVVAGESASFVQVLAPKLGLVPDMGSSWMVTRLVGRAQAMGMAMLGDAVKAKDAEALGLIWKCVPDVELTSTVQTIANRLASGPTQAFVSLRPLFDRAWSNTFMQQVDLECEMQEKLVEQPDYKIGVQAFRNKSKPQFTGKAKL